MIAKDSKKVQKIFVQLFADIAAGLGIKSIRHTNRLSTSDALMAIGLGHKLIKKLPV